MTRTLILVVAAALVLCERSATGQSADKTSAPPRPMSLPEAIEFVRPSVVQIAASVDLATAGGQFPGRPAAIGTGFMVNEDGYVVTARHVIEFFRSIQAPGKHLWVGVGTPNLDDFKIGKGSISLTGNFGLTEAAVAAEDELHDVVILKMKQNPFFGQMGTFVSGPGQKIDYLHKAAILSPDRPRDGELVAASGYPLNKMALVTTSGSVASGWDYEMKQVHPPNAPPGFMIPESSDSYLVDMHVNHGNSGGPVYTIKDGGVIGICVSFNEAPVEHGNNAPSPQADPLYFNSGLGNVVPIRYAVELLKKNNLKWKEMKSIAVHPK